LNLSLSVWNVVMNTHLPTRMVTGLLTNVSTAQEARKNDTMRSRDSRAGEELAYRIH
jgi:hypothetical protein